MNLEQIAKEIAYASIKIGSIKLSPDAPFTWTTGYNMPIYNDNRKLLSLPEIRSLIADAFELIIKQNNIDYDVVAGTSTAGIPHATTLADKLKSPLVYVRSKAKEHGMGKRVEGDLKESQKVVVIEDLISSGASSVSVVQALREEGAEVTECLAIFSYGFKSSEDLFQSIDCKLRTILTFDTILNCALEMSYISEAQKKILNEWYFDPFNWGEKHGFPRRNKD